MRRLDAVIYGGLVVLVAVMPFHAFLVVWLGHLAGHESLWQGWKEAVTAVLAILAAIILVRRPSARQLLLRPINLVVIGFFALAILVTVVARPSLSGAAYGLKTDLEFLVLFVIAQLVASERLVRRLVIITLLTGAATAVIGLALVTVLPHDTLAHFGYGPATVLPFEGVDPAISAVRTPSTLGGPNQFGAFLILPLCLAVGLMVRRFRWWQPLFVLLISAGIWVSYSRAALIGAVIGGVAALLLALPKRRAFQAGAIALLLVAGGGIGLMSLTQTGNKLQYYVLHQSATATNSRASTSQHLTSFQNGLDAITSSPLGRGLGTAGPASYHSDRPFIPESYYLQLGIETGVIGLILFLALTIKLGLQLIRLRANNSAPGLLGALIGLSLVSLVLHGWADSTIAIIFWIIAGALLGAAARRPSAAVDGVNSVYLAGVRLDNVTLDETITHVATMIKRHEPGLIATVNAEFIIKAQTDRAFRDALNHAALAIPDGSGPTILSRLLGTPLRARIPGVDLAERLAAESAQHGWRLFLLGAGPDVADQAARIWQQRYPGLIIAGTNAGSKAPEAAAAISEEIRRAKADIVYVAFNFPRQELWITENLAATGAAVGIGLGGTFNYITGRFPRAPRLMRRLGLEWLFRFATQPTRAKRMLAIPRLVILVLRFGSKISRP